MSNPYETPESTNKSRPTCFELATSRPIVIRSLLIAIIVGSILCGINHGACIFNGKFGKMCLFQSLLTTAVPYVVSVVSSVQALRRHEDAQSNG